MKFLFIILINQLLAWIASRFIRTPKPTLEECGVVDAGRISAVIPLSDLPGGFSFDAVYAWVRDRLPGDVGFVLTQFVCDGETVEIEFLLTKPKETNE